MIIRIKNKCRPFMVFWRRFIYGENKFTALQKVCYASGTSNHLEHNANKDYWDILLGNLKNEEKWKGKNALDFACGKGRNVTNLKQLADWNKVDGADISEANIAYCHSAFDQSKSSFFCTNGIDLAEVKSDYYDFIMSTIALQHIPVYEIRKSILNDIYRVLKADGVFSFQMGYGVEMIDNKGQKMAGYYENAYGAKGTNSDHDVQVTNIKEIQDDLIDIGFKDIQISIKPSYSDLAHKEWIYVSCSK